jgi:hypothetical protein
VFSNTPTLTNATLSGTLSLSAPLTVANGGTGTSTYVKGDILYASAANTLSKLPIGTEGQVLLTSGTGIPNWGSNGLYSLNGLTASTHIIATNGVATSNFSITSVLSGTTTATHTIGIPDASTTSRGLISTGTQSFAGDKTFNNDLFVNNTYFGRGNSQNAGPGVAYNLSIGVGSKNFNAASTGTTGNYNIAIGASSLITLAGGTNNNAVGYYALKSNTAGSSNNAFGANALSNNTSGNYNTAVGEGALSLNAGTQALGYGSDNTAVGYASLTSNVSGYQNTAIGSTSGVAANNLSNATAIGFGARVNADNTIQLGNTSVLSVVTSGTLSATGAVLTNLRVTGGSGTAGRVLTSDASGNATWQSASGGITGVGTITTTTQANGAAISGTSTLVLAEASSSSPGILTTGIQTIAGNKTFSGTLSTTSLVAGNLTSTSLVTNTLRVTGGTFTRTNAVLTNDGNGNATWQTASAGISGVGTITTTSYVNGATVSGNELILAAASLTQGGILTNGTQTIAGNKTFSGTLSTTSLVLSGNLTATSANFSKAVKGAAASAFTGETIDFANSNLAYSTYSSTAVPGFTLLNIYDGGTYTFVWRNANSTGTPQFSATGFELKSLGTYPTVLERDAVYTFVVMGNRVYYSMISTFN